MHRERHLPLELYLLQAQRRWLLTSLLSAVVMYLPSWVVSMEVTSFPVSMVFTSVMLRMSHTLRTKANIDGLVYSCPRYKPIRLMVFSDRENDIRSYLLMIAPTLSKSVRRHWEVECTVGKSENKPLVMRLGLISIKHNSWEALTQRRVCQCRR